jgi:hypothetical protein
VSRSFEERDRYAEKGPAIKKGSFLSICLHLHTKKELFMKRLRSILFALTVLLLASAAQAQQTSVRATVPFDFVIGNHVYPAGEYALKSITINDVPIRVENLQEATSRFILSGTCTSDEQSTSTKLVFHRIGDRYFLYQVWEQGNTEGREFPVSPAERQIAQNREKRELVVVAANIE